MSAKTARGEIVASIHELNARARTIKALVVDQVDEELRRPRVGAPALRVRRCKNATERA